MFEVWVVMSLNGGLFHSIVLGKNEYRYVSFLRIDSGKNLKDDCILWRIVWQVTVKLVQNV